MEVEENLKCDDCNSNLSHALAYLTQAGTMVCEKCAAPFLASLNPSNNPAPQEEIIKELPLASLEKLKCSQCSDYLSIGPIYLNKKYSSVCGRCGTDDLPGRNTQYEALAEFMLFPCRFKKFGCLETVRFSINEECEHEKKCKYRKESCPLMPTQCRWVGLQEEFTKHCQNDHADHLQENPLNLSYDVTLPSVCTFIINAFDHLFIFHTRVCTNTKNIYSIVQHLEGRDQNMSCKFDYIVSILRGNKMVRRTGQIVPHEKINYNSTDFLVTSIKSLEKALEGLDDCVFNISINKFSKPISKCVKCNKIIDKFLYQEGGFWSCETCIPEKTTTCKNQGCFHKDLEKKCQKHELFFCPFSTWCWICVKDVRKGDFVNHYNTKHKDKTQKEGVMFQIEKTNIYEKILLIPTKAGNAIIKYRLTDTEFTAQIRSNIPSKDLNLYHCIVKVCVPGETQKLTIYVLNTLYNEMHDWKLDVKGTDNFPDKISITVNILKGQKPKLLGLKNVVYQ